MVIGLQNFIVAREGMEMTDLSQMNEAERAAYYQDHRSSDQLEKVPSPVTAGKRPRLSASITVRFSPAEAEIVRRAAQASDSSYSDVVRAAVRQLAAPRYYAQNFRAVFSMNTWTGTIFQQTDLGGTATSIPQTGRMGAARTI